MPEHLENEFNANLMAQNLYTKPYRSSVRSSVSKLILCFLTLIAPQCRAAQEQLAIILGLDDKWRNCPFSEIEKAANAGDVNAQVNLAMILEVGGDSIFSKSPDITKQAADPSKALLWYRKAAEKGHPFAQNNLALMLYYGRGVETNREEAIRWLTAAAEQGETAAQANLALHFMQIEINGVAYPNYTEAAKWYLKAAEGDDWYSQYDIGLAYESGLGVVRDRVEALKWFYLSASHGRERAKLAADKLESILTRDQITDAGLRAKSFTPRKAGALSSNSVSGPLVARRTPRASGSAFFITEDGFLITSEHVVEGASEVCLVMKTGSIAAKVVKVSEADDLALLKANGTFTTLPIASSRTVKLGNTVATVGFPNLILQGFAPKLAKGEIASLSGAVDDVRFFQISVPVQPGNSGGPLVDEHGNVVGVVAAKLSARLALKTSGVMPENVNYALKSSYLLSFLESTPDVSARLKENSTRQRKFEDVVKDAEQAAVLVLVY